MLLLLLQSLLRVLAHKLLSWVHRHLLRRLKSLIVHVLLWIKLSLLHALITPLIIIRILIHVLHSHIRIIYLWSIVVLITSLVHPHHALHWIELSTHVHHAHVAHVLKTQPFHHLSALILVSLTSPLYHCIFSYIQEIKSIKNAFLLITILKYFHYLLTNAPRYLSSVLYPYCNLTIF